MGLSKDLISQFVKATKDNTSVKKESTVYGTVVKYNDKTYVKIDGSDLLTPAESLSSTEDGERVSIMIKDHTAIITGNYTAPSASSIKVDEMEAELKVNSADVKNLVANYAEIETLVADKASIRDLEVVNANIKNLKADKADIKYLEANYATIGSLNATNANINTLTSDVATISTLINGNLTSDNIQSMIITSDKFTVANGFIKNAMIDTVSASKINAGQINTNNVIIQSDDGGMLLQGNLQQFKDANGNVRIQIGKDGTGDFTFALYDETGQGQLINKDGIQSSNAIADGIIVDAKIPENANINAGKLDISSLFRVINNNEETIKSSKIYFDGEGQTLEIAFNQLKNKVDTIEQVTIDGDLSSVIEQVTTNTTNIDVMQGQISSLIADTTITKENGEVVQLKDEYNSTKDTVNSHTHTIGSLQTDLEAANSDIKTVQSKQVKLEQNLDGFKQTVSDTYQTKDDMKGYSTTEQMNSAINQKANEITQSVSETYTTKTYVDGINIGTRNLLRWTNEGKTLTGNGTENQCIKLYDISDASKLHGKTATLSFQYTVSNWTAEGGIKAQTGSTTYDGFEQVWFTSNGTFEYVSTIEFNADNWDTELQLIADWFNGTVEILPNTAILVISDKKADWSLAPEDTDDYVKSLTTRMNTAESKLTAEGLTTTIGSHYTTSEKVDDLITAKGYATTSQVEQTASDLTAKFSASGGYNAIPNSSGLFGTDGWYNSGMNSFYSITGGDIPKQFSARTCFIAGNNTETEAFIYSNYFPLKSNTTYTLSGKVSVDNNCNGIDIHMVTSESEIEAINEVWAYALSVANETWWQYFTYTFTTGENVLSGRFRIDNNGSKTHTEAFIYFGDLLLEEGELASPWSPHPNEVKSGITQINAEGIKVYHDSIDGENYTHMSPSGFYTKYKGTDVFQVDENGIRLNSYLDDTNWTNIQAGYIECGGTLATRGWMGETYTDHTIKLKSENGKFRARNDYTETSLYMGDRGLSTTANADLGSAGIIDFHSYWYDYGSKGLVMYSNNHVGLVANNGYVNISPEWANRGYNTFSFQVLDASTGSARDMDGMIYYGSHINGYGTCIRVSKDTSDPGIDILNGDGKTKDAFLQASHLWCDDLNNNHWTNGTLTMNQNYQGAVKGTQTYLSGTSISATNIYQNGSAVSGSDIVLKDNIKEYEDSALDIINQTKVYSFNRILANQDKTEIGFLAQQVPDIFVFDKGEFTAEELDGLTAEDKKTLLAKKTEDYRAVLENRKLDEISENIVSFYDLDSEQTEKQIEQIMDEYHNVEYEVPISTINQNNIIAIMFKGIQELSVKIEDLEKKIN